MSTEIIFVILIGGMVVLFFMGVEVAWAIALMAIIGLLLFVKQPLSQVGWTAWWTLDSFVLVAVPLFIFMGLILANTGASERLFSAVEKWFDRVPGSLACSTIGANAIFGAMCGSTIAATATFGLIAWPEMEKRGYNPGLGLSTIGMAAILAPLIPPSLILIVYAAWQGLPIVKVFAAGIIPGIILTTLLIITVAIRVKLNPSLAPSPAKSNWKEKVFATKELLPFMVVILIVLGVIFGGVMTTTEAAAMGAFLAIVLGLAYRRLTLAILKKSLLDTVKVTSMTMIIYAMAILLTHVLNSTGITPTISSYVVGLPFGKYGILALLVVMYFVGGMFLTSWEMMFLSLPFVIPIITELGFNIVWFGIFFVLVAEQAAVTPPFGIGLFILHGIAPRYPIEVIFRGALPLLAANYITLLIITMFPGQTVLWLSKILG